MRRYFPIVLIAHLAACSSPTQPGSSAARDFEQFWNNFDVTYSYFEYKRINWDSLREAYRARAEQAVNTDALIAVLREMTAPLRDGHVWFEHTDGRRIGTYSPGRAINWQRDPWVSYVGRNGWQQISTWGYAVMGDIGYIAIGSWNTEQVRVEDFDGVLERLRGTRAIIFDVRMNGGGNDAIALQVAARFADRSRAVEHFRFRQGPAHGDFGPLQTRTLAPRGAWQFLKPVVLLSGRGVFSSNESFVAAMRELPHVTVMGDTTGGSSGNPAFFDLRDGWRYTVPRWIAYTADMRVIEWNGIAPDITIPTSTLDFSATDPIIEAARKHIGS